MSESSPRILIIDNDEGVVAAITARLESMGYQCVTASTGAQGIAAFRDQDINLVITDLNMPAGDGVVLTRTLRETSDVPIIIVTGFHDEYRSDLSSIPSVILLEKPFDSNDLIDIVETELALHDYQKS